MQFLRSERLYINIQGNIIEDFLMAGVNQVFNLADDFARYVKACGKRSILECKPLQGKINPKDLGVIHSDGTINFTTQEAAIEYMRTKCTRALQGKKTYEHSVSIKGNSIIDEDLGNIVSCNPSRTGADICGHGHPDTYAKGCTTAPSIIDYHSLWDTKTQIKELIFNSNGETYSMTKIPNVVVKNEKVFGCYYEIDILAAKHYFKTQPKSIQAKLNKAIREKDLQTFEDIINEYLPKSPNDTTKEITELSHTFWLKYGKKMGVEVYTNFSNFKNILA